MRRFVATGLRKAAQYAHSQGWPEDSHEFSDPAMTRKWRQYWRRAQGVSYDFSHTRKLKWLGMWRYVWPETFRQARGHRG